MSQGTGSPSAAEPDASPKPTGRLRSHAARWGLLVFVALVTWFAFPPFGLGVEPGHPLTTTVGAILYNCLILSIFWLLLAFYRRETYVHFHEVSFIAGLFALVVLLSAAILHIFPDRPELLPISFAAILLTMLYNGRLAVYAAATLAMLLGSRYGIGENPTLLFGLTGGVAAALSLRAIRRRSQLYRTIAVMALASGLASLALGLMFNWTAERILTSAAAGAISALGSVSVALICLPLAESLTRITTDLTLLELSDPSRPLLRRLSLEAPGTWAHSVQMANLCESACNAIGANGLLARVGCYYHDVGKLTNPRFFVENQIAGVNPHDALPPQESARIIRLHVLGGLALAEAAKLPPAVRNFIPEHHGTSRIDYFFEQARSPGQQPGPDVEDFEYPGPRPRSAETAITMLADAAEAALRVLDDPTPERVREAVEYLVRQRVASGQLQEAPLTLKDLDLVTREFVRIMTGMYHNRIEYPTASGGIGATFGRKPGE
ncbi:MAG: HDIG domain-containing metalloprotein [Gemmatimonadota bacterium]